MRPGPRRGRRSSECATLRRPRPTSPGWRFRTPLEPKSTLSPTSSAWSLSSWRTPHPGSSAPRSRSATSDSSCSSRCSSGWTTPRTSKRARWRASSVPATRSPCAWAARRTLTSWQPDWPRILNSPLPAPSRSSGPSPMSWHANTSRWEKRSSPTSRRSSSRSSPTSPRRQPTGSIGSIARTSR